MMRCTAWGLALALLGSGCASSSAIPGTQPDGMMALAYNGGLQVWSDGEAIAAEPSFDELERHVDCDPRARKHARAARRHGRRAKSLGWIGGTLGVVSLGGLGGLALVRDHPRAGGAVIGTGLAIGLLGVALAGVSRTNRNRAAGNAVDAVNYYNDAARSGRRCRRRDTKREYPTRHRRIVAPAVGPTLPPDADVE